MPEISITVTTPDDYAYELNPPDPRVLKAHLGDAVKAALFSANDDEHVRDLPVTINVTGWVA